MDNNHQNWSTPYLRNVRRAKAIQKVAQIFFGRDAVRRDLFCVSVNIEGRSYSCNTWEDLDHLLDADKTLLLDQ